MHLETETTYVVGDSMRRLRINLKADRLATFYIFLKQCKNISMYRDYIGCVVVNVGRFRFFFAVK